MLDRGWGYLPVVEGDIANFGKQIIEEFVKDLLEQSQAVSWNMGFDTVVFEDKIIELKETYLGIRSNQSTQISSQGTGSSGAEQQD